MQSHIVLCAWLGNSTTYSGSFQDVNITKLWKDELNENSYVHFHEHGVVDICLLFGYFFHTLEGAFAHRFDGFLSRNWLWDMFYMSVPCLLLLSHRVLTTVNIKTTWNSFFFVKL